MIVALYVDDMNPIGNLKELEKIASHLKSELDLKLEHCVDGILVNQSNCTMKVLRHFNEDRAKPSSTPMVIHTLDAARDSFRQKEDEEVILEPEVPYLSAIGTLLYLAQYIRPNISFVVKLLARYSFGQHAATEIASKTYSVTLKALRIWAYSIHMHLRMV